MKAVKTGQEEINNEIVTSIHEHLKKEIYEFKESYSIIEEGDGKVEEELKMTWSIVNERVNKTAEALVCADEKSVYAVQERPNDNKNV